LRPAPRFAVVVLGVTVLRVGSYSDACMVAEIMRRNGDIPEDPDEARSHLMSGARRNGVEQD
jgi:hypothetical protein